MSVYLDWAATSPSDREILQESLELSCTAFGNPSSVHREGKKAATLLSEARDRCARALGVKSGTIVFTSGGTEADHLPLLALLQRPVRGTVAVSAIEHPAILEQARLLENTGWKTLVIPADREGFISIDAVLATIRDDTAFVSVMAVNNETGAIQPVAEIAASLAARCAGKRKPHFHVDAVQSAGKIPFAPGTTGIDSAAISAHKIQGPRGAGLLYLARRVEPFIRGGGQEGGLRPGTENLAGAWALSRCLEKSVGALAEHDGTESCAYLIEKLASVRGVRTIPESRKPVDGRFSPWIVQFTNDFIPGEVLVRALSDRNICISTGSACSSRKKTRPVLQAMRVDADAQRNAFRVSTGRTTTREEIDALASAMTELLSGL